MHLQASKLVASAPAPAERRSFDVRASMQRLLGVFVSRRFATFVVFGGLAALTNLAVARVLYTVPQFAEVLPYWTAIAIGTVSGMLVNFTLNYALNFRYFARSAAAQLRTFTIVSVIGTMLTVIVAQTLNSLATMVFDVRAVHIGQFSLDVELLAHMFAIGIVMFYSFAAHSAFSFNVGLRRRIARAFTGNRE